MDGNRNKSKRIRAITKKWQENEEHIILDYFKKIMKNQFEIEKPSAPLFYDKMIKELKFENVTANQLKHKARNLRSGYIKACEWLNETEPGADVGFIRDHILTICPHWDTLDELFGKKSLLHPPCNFASCNVDDATDYGGMFCSADGSLEPKIEEVDALSSPIIPNLNSEFRLQSAEIKNEEPVQTLENVKTYLSISSEDSRNSWNISNLSSTLSEAQMIRATAMAEKNKIEAKYKEEELKLSWERFKFEKEIRKREIELEYRKLESAEKLKILELENDKKVAKLKLEYQYKLQIELAKIRKI